jgi:hypothetical protein
VSGVATSPYVDRLIRIFRDRPSDDTSALVLIDFANASIAAMLAAAPPTPEKPKHECLRKT